MITTAYKCETCEDKPTFNNSQAMFAHLRNVHHLEGNPIKGIQIPRAFMDGKGWYAQVFGLKFSDIEITQTVEGTTL